MYQALYRKWRPRNFADVVGQEAITGALLNQIQSERIAHAYLFTGTRGTGKTTCAKVLATAVNCENPQPSGPCGECPCCHGIENGSMLDVVEIDAASNNGVDDVRDLRDETVYRPGRCRYKVYIVDEVHMLSIQAFNALLKILEEPPSHVIFILATTEIHKVPATILSRCQRYDFLRIPQTAIQNRLLHIASKEAIDLSEQAASLIAVLGDGSMRDALSLLDTCAAFGEAVTEELVRTMAGVTDKKHLFSIAEATREADINAMLSQISALRERSVDIRRLCEELISHYRNCLLALAQPNGDLLDFLPATEKDDYLSMAKKHTEAGCIRSLRRLAEALDKMGRSPDPRVELELALFDIANLAPSVQATPATPPSQTPRAPISTQAAPAPTFTKVEPLPVSEAEPTPPPAFIPQQDTFQSSSQKEPSPSVTATATPAPAPLPTAAPAPALDAKQEIHAFVPWPQIIEQIRQMDTMVYSFVKSTSAYYDGSHVLIDGGDVFLEFMRSNKNVSEIIKTAIQTVTGTRCGIGPYTKKIEETPFAQTTKRTLEEWQQKGVPIEYETDTEDKGDKK